MKLSNTIRGWIIAVLFLGLALDSGLIITAIAAGIWFAVAVIETIALLLGWDY